MANAVIYYKMSSNESIKQAVINVEILLDELKKDQNVVGVFVDQFNSSVELMDLLNSPLTELDCLYLNQKIDDEFDSILISELSKRDSFKVRLLY